MCARKHECQSIPTPELNRVDTDCFRVLIFNDFEDEQLLNLSTMIEFHGSDAKVEIFVEEGTDHQKFSLLMASVRKAVPHIQFNINLEVPVKTLHEIEREHEAEGGTVFDAMI